MTIVITRADLLGLLLASCFTADLVELAALTCSCTLLRLCFIGLHEAGHVVAGR